MKQNIWKDCISEDVKKIGLIKLKNAQYISFHALLGKANHQTADVVRKHSPNLYT